MHGLVDHGAFASDGYLTLRGLKDRELPEEPSKDIATNVPGRRAVKLAGILEQIKLRMRSFNTRVKAREITPEFLGDHFLLKSDLIQLLAELRSCYDPIGRQLDQPLLLPLQLSLL
ncbi:hypothetical protein [Microbacterium testaceum]|uniref:hypothetical protein n=1 Tax=Microbacterium testaceum TaxID=2033 RepID=UPI002AC397E6|nr:hypothetical protein [Microbacterium testaceum]MDZ5144584.1 hypothetical protein [Microbacterium testaceum]